MHYYADISDMYRIATQIYPTCIELRHCKIRHTQKKRLNTEIIWCRNMIKYIIDPQ